MDRVKRVNDLESQYSAGEFGEFVQSNCNGDIEQGAI